MTFYRLRLGWNYAIIIEIRKGWGGSVRATQLNRTIYGLCNWRGQINIEKRKGNPSISCPGFHQHRNWGTTLHNPHHSPDAFGEHFQQTLRARSHGGSSEIFFLCGKSESN